MPIPCKCSGSIVEKCQCSSQQAGSSNEHKYRPLIGVKNDSKTNLIPNTFEEFYETCAAYNLRHCPITGFLRHDKDYLKHTIRDIGVLICFLLTSSVVLLAITCKMLVHMALLLSIIFQRIKRMFVADSATAGVTSQSSQPTLQSKRPVSKSDAVTSTVNKPTAIHLKARV